MQTLKFTFHALIVMSPLILAACPAVAANQERAQQKTPAGAESSEPIYGSQLMTHEERAEHRSKMRNLKTREEREAYRIDHHRKMQERAKKMGKTIPEMPPMQGCGAGYGGPGCGGTGRAETESGGAGY